MTVITATRYHDISCGHRVYGHESKCAFLHGHNYRVHFECSSDSLDELGRVIDFSVIKSSLCMWIENHWDHKFLFWEQDPWCNLFANAAAMAQIPSVLGEEHPGDRLGIVRVPFNPTAENMAEYLLNIVGPLLLDGTSIRVTRVTIDETRKCSATAQHGYRHNIFTTRATDTGRMRAHEQHDSNAPKGA